MSVAELAGGGGTLTAAATVDAGRYTTTVGDAAGLSLLIGHVLPADAEIQSVTLDGEQVPHTVISTARGQEVRVEAGGSGEHLLVVEAG